MNGRRASKNIVALDNLLHVFQRAEDVLDTSTKELNSVLNQSEALKLQHKCLEGRHSIACAIVRADKDVKRCICSGISLSLECCRYKG